MEEVNSVDGVQHGSLSDKAKVTSLCDRLSEVSMLVLNLFRAMLSFKFRSWLLYPGQQHNRPQHRSFAYG